MGFKFTFSLKAHIETVPAHSQRDNEEEEEEEDEEEDVPPPKKETPMEVERLSDDKHAEQEQGASVSGNGAQLKEKGMKEAQSQGIKGPALPPGWAQEATIADDEEESNKKGNKVSQVRNNGGASMNWGLCQIHPKFPSSNKKT